MMSVFVFELLVVESFHVGLVLALLEFLHFCLAFELVHVVKSHGVPDRKLGEM